MTRSDDATPPESHDEEDLLIVLPLSNDQMGTQRERTELDQFAERLEAAAAQAQAGEYDGNELGGGECILFFAGPSASRLLEALRPLLTGSVYGKTARVRMQRGQETIERAL